MASLEAFDKDVKDLVTSGKLSSSKIKAVTDAAMANIASDAHIVATLFKVHKQARSSHKISSLYLIDAIAREARQQVKKAARGKQSTSNSNTPLQDGTGSAANDDSDEVSSDKRRASSRGTHASFLSKIESFLDRLVLEVLSKGPPEHKDKVKKVVDIWKKSSTFSSEALKPCYARLAGEVPDANATGRTSQPDHSSTTPTHSQRSTTPPYPPPEVPISLPQFPTQSWSTGATQSSHPSSQAPQILTNGAGDQAQHLAALLGTIAGPFSSAPTVGTHVPAQSVAPSFEISQLALLQQLAAQTSSATSTGSSNPVAVQATVPAFLAQQPKPYPDSAAPVPSSSYLPDEPNRQQEPATTNNWSRAPTSNSLRRERSPRRDGRRPSQWDQDSSTRQTRDGEQVRRSVSPPGQSGERYSRARQRSPPRRRSPPRLDNGQGRNFGQPDNGGPSFRREPRSSRNEYQHQQEPRPIATFISEDRRDDRSSNKNRDNRHAVEMDDFSSFEVPTNDSHSQAKAAVPSFPEETWDQNEGGSSQGPDLLKKAAAFNGATFNPLEPESWASFAVMCQNNFGHLPSNMEMMQWIMSSMTMMQASMAQMQGGDGMMGQQGMAGMMQGMQGNSMGGMQQPSFSENHEDTYGHQQDYNEDGNAWNKQDLGQREQERASSIEPDRRPPPPSRDEGEGEADMQMTPEAE